MFVRPSLCPRMSSQPAERLLSDGFDNSLLLFLSADRLHYAFLKLTLKAPGGARSDTRW